MIAECLDCIFDVFGSDDHNAVLKELGLVQKLKELLPLYKEKVKHNIGNSSCPEFVKLTIVENITIILISL